MRWSSLLLLVGTNERGDGGRKALGIHVDGKALGRAGQTRGAHLRAPAAPADDYDPRRALRRRDRRGGDQAAAAKLALEETDVGPLAGDGREQLAAVSAFGCDLHPRARDCVAESVPHRVAGGDHDSNRSSGRVLHAIRVRAPDVGSLSVRCHRGFLTSAGAFPDNWVLRSAAEARMDYRVLGPVEASSGGRPLHFGGAQQRALLAYLLLHANEVVSADRLLDELWAAPPGGGVAAVRTQVSRLRKELGEA